MGVGGVLWVRVQTRRLFREGSRSVSVSSFVIRYGLIGLNLRVGGVKREVWFGISGVIWVRMQNRGLVRGVSMSVSVSFVLSEMGWREGVRARSLNLPVGGVIE